MVGQSRAIHSVFHPTDLPADDTGALSHALSLSLACCASLTIFHRSQDAEPGGEESFPSVRRILEHWGRLPVGSRRADFKKLGLSLKKVEAHGSDPVRSAAHYLQHHHADLMVLATEARKGLVRLLEPSIAEPLARSVDCMTLFVPHGSRWIIDPASGQGTIRNVMIAVDHDPEPGPALWGAAALAETLGAGAVHMHCLHVGSSAAPELVLPSLADATWQVDTRTGGVVESILTRAHELDADLLVMPTHGHDGILDALRGSVTEQVLRQAGRPLLAVPVPAT